MIKIMNNKNKILNHEFSYVDENVEIGRGA